MTQAQYSAIVAFMTQRCQLIETAFIEEMTDHFVISIETRMANSLSFDQALELTIMDFGGRKNIQKMEWAYRKVFLINLLRDWWTLVKSQFSKSKGIRTMIVGGFFIVVGFYFGLTDFIGVSERKVLWNAVQWGSIPSVFMLTLFLLQYVIPPFKKVGVIRSPSLLRTMFSYLLWASTFLLFLGISSLEMPLLLKGLSYSALWSTSAVLYLAFLDYSMKTAPELWYQTK